MSEDGAAGCRRRLGGLRGLPGRLGHRAWRERKDGDQDSGGERSHGILRGSARIISRSAPLTFTLPRRRTADRMEPETAT